MVIERTGCQASEPFRPAVVGPWDVYRGIFEEHINEVLVESTIEFAIVYVPAIRRTAGRTHMSAAPRPIWFALVCYTPSTETTIDWEILLRILFKRGLVFGGSEPKFVSFVVDN